MKLKRPFKFLLIKTAALVLLLLCSALLAAGCADQNTADDIDMDDLHGVRVGVNLAWESDYFMTERGDAEIYRYDSTADMLMALSFNKIDALALDALSCRILENVTDGLEVMQPPAGMSGYLLFFKDEEKDLMDDFNKFIEEYKQTDEYKDYLERLDAYDGGDYIGPEIEPEGSGRVVKIAAGIEEFPRAYFEAGSDVPTGYDVEIVKRWANASDIRIEWYQSGFEDAVAGIRAGKYDAAVGYLSEFYRSEAEQAGLLASDAFSESPIYLMRKTEERITIRGEVD